ncbi:hypothetical protein JVT61DRAFT_15488 [Boletus reticuloceps]|uniref:Uncharacterized protein n=1 Tax=Boletus reticuloceps TaxID=495285 RepID=A0A8I3A2J8_9AGAM|nr:hypothetical protein JVT61DRAFT_15488 [Boletus reticuloceps]
MEDISQCSSETCEGTTKLLLRLYKARNEGQEIFVLSVLSEQFSLIRQTTSWFLKHFRKPRELVVAQIHHNQSLLADEDTIIPDVTLEFSVKDDSSDPIYPVVCQIAFSQMFRDARDEIWSLANSHSSLYMAIIVDIKEGPSFTSPTSKSNTWKTLSQDLLLDYVSFINHSSLSETTAEFTWEPLVVAGHRWFSIKEVVYYVWIKPADSDRLDVDGETTPGNAGEAKFEAMLLHGLEEVKKSVISLCETIIRDADHPSPNLTTLRSHTTILPDSLSSFNEKNYK